MSRPKPTANDEPIAGYTLRRYLGRGGFGEVWEAIAPGGLAKAVKLAPIDRTSDGFTCRELEGLRKIRDVRHPYLLSIERFEVVDGYLVIVMELADRNLADRFNECSRESRAGIPRGELIHYLTEAAEVLDLLNERHALQHLDIKPENLFLCGDHVKVADFGLVQPKDTQISRSMIAISPPYAPPELFDGRIESTADQYSLAVTYQELLTGTRPYTGTDVRTLILQHLKGRPELAALPPSDRPIVSRALARDPAARFASCTEFVNALAQAPNFEAHLTETRTPILTPTPSRRSTIKPEAPARPHHGRAPLPRETSRASNDTTLAAHAATWDNAPFLAHDESVESTFIAFLPVEVFAHKLRGFIDAMSAEVIACKPEDTQLYMGAPGWFGRTGRRGINLRIETYVRNPHSGFRVVHATVWANGQKLAPSDIARRGMLLIRCLKYYLMAHDDAAAPSLQSAHRIRASLLA